MISVRNLSGALVAVTIMMRNRANLLVPVTIEARDPSGDAAPTTPPVPALSASASPASVSGAVSRPGASLVSTNASTVSVVGGAGPYSYSWVPSDGAMTADDPAAAVTRFSATIEGQESASDTFTCTVTDASGATATTTVFATVNNYGKALGG